MWWFNTIEWQILITGKGDFGSAVAFAGMMYFDWSSRGSSSPEALCHHTAPFPSMVPLPLIVSPTNLVNWSHCSRPEPQGLELVGAMIVPSNYTNYIRKQINTILLLKLGSFDFDFDFFFYLENNVVLTVWAGK